MPETDKFALVSRFLLTAVLRLVGVATLRSARASIVALRTLLGWSYRGRLAMARTFAMAELALGLWILSGVTQTLASVTAVGPTTPVAAVRCEAR
jgi:hypothetical protein